MGSDVIEPPILQAAVPPEVLERAAQRLPSMAPVEGKWLFCDDVYDGQVALRRRLLAERPGDVYAQTAGGLAAARKFAHMALADLPDGFSRTGDSVVCPDGAQVPMDWDAPLFSLGQILQQDVCILEKQGPEHVLTGAVLCFPASWTLAQKIGRPLIQIHNPVPEYDAGIARRVQRLFDGVRDGRPMWRANALRYDDPQLYQPRTEADPRPISSENAGFFRSERQTVLRIPQSGAVAFVIHTYVVTLPLEKDG